MSRLERLALLGYFAIVVLLLASQALLPTLVGAVAGVVAGVALAGRLGRLQQRMDATLGDDAGTVVATGFRPRRVVTRVVVHLVVLFLLLVPTAVVPFVGDQVFAALAAAATGLPFVVTGRRLGSR